METIKNVVGLGKKDQEGQEPVSGVKGEGTAGQPFDAGNTEGNPELGGKAPQPTDPSNVTGQPSTDTKPADGKSAKNPSPTSGAETSKENSGSGEKKAAGWFKSATSALPFGKRKEDGQAAAGGSKETSKTESGLPPNHLGDDVPEGVSTEPVAEDSIPTIEVGGSEDATAPAPIASQAIEGAVVNGKDKPADNEKADDTKEESKDQKPGFFMGMFTSSKKAEPEPGPPASSLQGTNAPIYPDKPVDDRKTSLKAADKQRRESYASNPERIPKAGGVVVGQRASQDRERRRSRMVSKSELPPVPGKADAKTEANTALNAVTGAGAKADERNDSGTAATTSSVPSPIAVGAGEGTEGRRKSMFGKVKEKVKK